MSAHTPGPWYVCPSGLTVADKRVWFDEHGARHGETPNMVITAMTPADARLIAAAPEALAAASAAAGLLEEIAPYHPQTAALRAAIDKALSPTPPDPTAASLPAAGGAFSTEGTP